MSLHRLSLRPAHTAANGSSDEAGTGVDADLLGGDEVVRILERMETGKTDDVVTTMLETDFIKKLVRMAVGPASLYNGTGSLPRESYFNILAHFLLLSTEAAESGDAKNAEYATVLSSVATHMLPHTSKLLALYNGGATNRLKEALVRFMSSAAAHHELLFDAIINEEGFLDAIKDDFVDVSRDSTDLCELLGAMAKRQPKLLNTDTSSVDIYNALLAKIRSHVAYSDDNLHEAYLGLLTAFWKDTGRIDAFRSTASYNFVHDVLAQYASRVEDEAHLPVLKLLAADGDAWRWLSEAARRNTTNSSWNLSKLGDALKDPQVLAGAATSARRPEPVAAYMLMAVWQLDEQKDGENATWWKKAWEKLDKAFDGDNVHGELIANMLHAPPLRGPPLRGLMYKETEERFEVSRKLNDSDSSGATPKRPRTGIGQFRALLELNRARLP